jgi:hypothetical protein
MADGGDRAEGWNGKWEGGMGYWCSLTHFCSYKHTTEGDANKLLTNIKPLNVLLWSFRDPMIYISHL